jgi:hypothetical protein
MANGDAALGGDERGGQRRIDVAGDQDQLAGVRLELSKRSMTRAVCWAWLAEPTSRKASGTGICRSSKKTWLMAAS